MERTGQLFGELSKSGKGVGWIADSELDPNSERGKSKISAMMKWLYGTRAYGYQVMHNLMFIFVRIGQLLRAMTRACISLTEALTLYESSYNVRKFAVVCTTRRNSSSSLASFICI